MRVVTAPVKYVKGKKDFCIFLAGGITNCEDWQSEVISLIEKESTVRKLIEQYGWSLHVFNPRRADFDVDDPLQSDIQIEWEWKMLEISDVIMFWFPKGNETRPVQPIALYELGKYTARRPERIVVGSSPEYSRNYDVTFQCRLESTPVCPTLEATVGAALIKTIMRSSL